MKKVILFLIPAILVPIIACQLSAWWFSGGNIFWQPVDYFPHSVDEILFLEAFGSEFWVKAYDGESYYIEYPCEGEQACWSQTDDVPEPDPSLHQGQFRFEGTCNNDSIAYPLFEEIETCITSTVLAESPWVVSLALTEKQNLWVWQKPWVSPMHVAYLLLINTLGGAGLGVFIGAILAWKVK